MGQPVSKERAYNPMCLAHVDWNKKGGQPIASSSSSKGFRNPAATKITLVPISSMAPTSVVLLSTSGMMSGTFVPITLSIGVPISSLFSAIMRLDLASLWRTTFHHGVLGSFA